MADVNKANLKVPEGLRPLLEALAREIIRSQPSDLISFSQKFFLELQNHRRANKGADILSNPVLYDRFKNDLYSKSETRLMVNNAASDENSRSHSPMDLAATKIQAAFRGHIVRKHPEIYADNHISKSRSNEHLTVAADSKNLKRHSVSGTEHDQNNEDTAATKIQAEIRGYLARKHVGDMRKKSVDAATKIQSHIRGYLTRKHLEEQGLSPTHVPDYRQMHTSNSDNM